MSFLGVGAPPTEPSLGTLIRIGQGFLFSGEWWILFFPACTLLVLALAVNLLGDWAARRAEPEVALMALLEIENLTVQFPTRRQTFTAVRDAHLTVEPGQIHGPSLRRILGLANRAIGAAGMGLLDRRGGIQRLAPSAYRRREEILWGCDARRWPDFAARRSRVIFRGPADLAQPPVPVGQEAGGNHPGAPWPVGGRADGARHQPETPEWDIPQTPKAPP